jgi:hypothetical protein
MMNRSISIPLALMTAAILSGCVGTGPNTQQGAVAGGAIGALTGAIIGNNSGGRNGASGALIGGLVGAIAGGTLGNSVDNQRGTVYRSPEEAATNVVVEQGPPPPAPAPVAEMVTAPPTPNAVWIPGYWAYNGASYLWVGGRWEVPPPHSRAYVAPYWAPRGRGYVYIRGYWR